jgi:hypothetical protein
MGYVLVKANDENSGGVAMNTQGGASFLLPMNQNEYDPAGMGKKYSERAAAAGMPWARAGQIAAYGGALYGGLNALNETLASGQGGGLLNDVGMGAYGGYATMSPLSSWAGERAARRFHGKEQAEQEEVAEKERLHQEGIADPTQGQRDRTGTLKPQFNIPAGTDTASFWGPVDQTQREFDNRSRYGHNLWRMPSWTPAAQPYVSPIMANSTQWQLPEGRQPLPPVRGAAPYDENEPAHPAVAEFTPSAPVGVTQSGTADPRITQGLKERRLDSY